MSAIKSRWLLAILFICFPAFSSPLNITTADSQVPVSSFDRSDTTEDVSVYDGLNIDQAYMHFLKVHRVGRPIPSGEELERRKHILAKNIERIREFNAQSSATDGNTLILGVTTHADQETEEYQNLLKAQIPESKPLPVSSDDLFVLADPSSLPDHWDWRDKGVVGPVKNQWFCGSCYIFSAVGVMETAFSITSHSRPLSGISLSEQQVLDCNGKDGCRGGNPIDVFKYAQKSGVCYHDQYKPYWSHEGRCDEKKILGCEGIVYVKNYYQLPRGSDLSMQRALLKTSLSVAMDASSWHFQFYFRGIYSSKHCPEKPSLNHALELVGYGEEDGRKYWIVKNSWGKLWGDWGYIKVDRDTVNTCGISEAASYPTVY